MKPHNLENNHSLRISRALSQASGRNRNQMFSTDGDNHLLTFAVLLCAALGPDVCPVILQYSVIAVTKRAI